MPKAEPAHRIGVTSFSQFVRLENCERFLRFRIYPQEVNAFRKKWGITEQPLTPLLKDAGSEFEENVHQAIVKRGEEVVQFDEKAEPPATVERIRAVSKPVVLLQAPLAGMLGKFPVHGKADAIRIERAKSGGLRALIADVKASRKERMEHQLQVAIYARLLRQMVDGAGLGVAELQGAVLHMQEDGSFPVLDPRARGFDLSTHEAIIDRLVVDADSTAARIATMQFDEVFFHLSYKCDGCLYNQICMYDTAERLDLSLTPYLTATEKRVLLRTGIKTLPHLAELMEMPEQGSGVYELRPSPQHQAKVEALGNLWPVGPNLPNLVQRARRAMHSIDKATSSAPFLFGSGFGTLPSDEDHPDLVKVFFDAQHDYLLDRVYMLSAFVVGPEGEESVVRACEAPPSEDDEARLLVEWVTQVIKAIRAVAPGDKAPIHMYCYNRYDQTVLLEALKRHLERVAALPAFFDLMTQHPALSQPVLSFLSEELQERRNLGMVCTPLHDAARRLGFNWKTDEYEFYSLFRARLFDNRRDVVRLPDGTLQHPGEDVPKGDPRRYTIESASRFNSQIPLEYAYGAWRKLPQSRDDSRVLEPFRAVTLEALTAFAAHRTRALAHIESSFRNKARFIDKPPLHLRGLAEAGGPGSLARSLEEFLHLEHHSALQAKLLNYGLPIERRVQTGLALLLRYERKVQGQDTHRFHIECESIGLDRALTMNAFRLKEGAWVVLNDAETQVSASAIKHGRLGIVRGVDSEQIVLTLLDLTFWQGKFRYRHNKDLAMVAGALYTLDEMADDLTADKSLAAIHNAASNTLYGWMVKPPSTRPVSQEQQTRLLQFCDLIDQLMGKNRRLTKKQREAVAGFPGAPLYLVQGPPGTGKSVTIGWAVLARASVAAAEGRPFRVAVSCKTHNATNIVLETIAASQKRMPGTRQFGGEALRGMPVYKIVNEDDDGVPAGVQPLKCYGADPGVLDAIFDAPFVVIGGTPGGLYNLMKYRGLGGNKVDWSAKPYDLLVVDEASQMSVPEGILAASFLAPQGNMIVVGDHRQMPPIVAHPWEQEHKRSITASRPYLSLFEFLIERDFPSVALDESFRLHEILAEFLRDNVYSLDGVPFFSRRKELLTQPPSVDEYVDAALDPHYPIVVIEHGERGSQQYNETEIALAAPLIEVCATKLRLDRNDGVGIVVPHRAQKALLRSVFPNLAVAESIDTVERFQGGERDVIIVSATASDPDYVRAEADFLLNLNRLNVALSRPRKKLIVIAAQSVVDLLVSDLEVFKNAVIWKRLYYQYASRGLHHGLRNGVPVWVKGAPALANGGQGARPGR